MKDTKPKLNYNNSNIDYSMFNIQSDWEIKDIIVNT